MPIAEIMTEGETHVAGRWAGQTGRIREKAKKKAATEVTGNAQTEKTRIVRGKGLKPKSLQEKRRAANMLLLLLFALYMIISMLSYNFVFRS